MLRTAPNTSNMRNRDPAHILRHQTFDIFAGFVGKDLMAIYTWIHLQQCIVVVRSFLRML